MPVLCEGTSRMTPAASDCTSEHGKNYFDSRLMSVIAIFRLADLKRAHVKVSAAHPVRRELDIHGRHAAAKADAPVFRPGARQRIGIGQERLCERQPSRVVDGCCA